MNMWHMALQVNLEKIQVIPAYCALTVAKNIISYMERHKTRSQTLNMRLFKFKADIMIYQLQRCMTL